MKIDLIQLEFINLNLRKMLCWIEEQIGWELTITSLYRIGDTGVHGTLPLRGIDVRIRNRKIGIAIETLVNHHWIYDTKGADKKCALLHGKDSNMHLHLQTHHSTKLVV